MNYCSKFPSKKSAIPKILFLFLPLDVLIEQNRTETIQKTKKSNSDEFIHLLFCSNTVKLQRQGHVSWNRANK